MVLADGEGVPLGVRLGYAIASARARCNEYISLALAGSENIEQRWAAFYAVGSKKS